MHSYHLFLANVLVYAIWIVSNSSMLISWGVRFSGFCPCIRGDVGTNFIGLDLYLSTDTGAQFSGLCPGEMQMVSHICFLIDV